MKTIALIGASGFVGSAILKEALYRDLQVTAIVRRPESEERSLPRPYRHINAPRQTNGCTVRIKGKRRHRKYPGRQARPSRRPHGRAPDRLQIVVRQDPDTQHVFGSGTHGVPLVDPPPDEPNDIPARNDNELPPLIGQRNFVVDQHVADLFPPPSHAERHESVALAPAPDLQRIGKLGFVEQRDGRRLTQRMRSVRGVTRLSQLSSSGIGVTMILPRSI